MGGYAKTPFEVLSDKVLSPSAKVAYGGLSGLLYRHGKPGVPEITTGRESLLEETGLSYDTLRVCLLSLEERGYIRILGNGGSRRTYILRSDVFGWSLEWEDKRIRRDTPTMKCLTLYQPHATLVSLGKKCIETRPQPSYYRGPLAIHAGMSDGWLKMCNREPFRSVLCSGGFADSSQLPRGYVVAVCILSGCFRMDDRVDEDGRLLYPDVGEEKVRHTVQISEMERSFGNYAPGRYGYILEDIVRLPDPIPAKGMQGMWNWPQPDNLGDLLYG